MKKFILMVLAFLLIASAYLFGAGPPELAIICLAATEESATFNSTFIVTDDPASTPGPADQFANLVYLSPNGMNLGEAAAYFYMNESDGADANGNPWRTAGPLRYPLIYPLTTKVDNNLI